MPSLSEVPKKSLSELVDELGEHQENLGPLKALVKQAQADVDRLEAEIEAKLDLPPEQSKIVTGCEFSATVSPRKNKTTIPSMRKVFNFLSRHKFLECCSIVLDKLKHAVTEEEYAKLTLTERTGPRTIQTYRLPALEQVQSNQKAA